jgi:hypothetical protein
MKKQLAALMIALGLLATGTKLMAQEQDKMQDNKTSQDKMSDDKMSHDKMDSKKDKMAATAH